MKTIMIFIAAWFIHGSIFAQADITRLLLQTDALYAAGRYVTDSDNEPGATLGLEFNLFPRAKISLAGQLVCNFDYDGKKQAGVAIKKYFFQELFDHKQLSGMFISLGVYRGFEQRIYGPALGPLERTFYSGGNLSSGLQIRCLKRLYFSPAAQVCFNKRFTSTSHPMEILFQPQLGIGYAIF
jgi:hypothetical protein